MLRVLCSNLSKVSRCSMVKPAFKSPAIYHLTKLYSTTGTEYSNQVYYGALTPQIRMVKVFSLATSVTGVFFQPILYQRMIEIGGMPMAAAALGIVGFFTFVTPFLLHIVTKKYVTHMTFDAAKEEYSAETITFFLRKRRTTFKTDDVKVPDVPGMFTSMLVKDIPLFVDPRMFNDPEHYVKIMGYDKPMDFKLGLVEEDGEKKEELSKAKK